MLCLRIFFVLFIEKPICHCILPLTLRSPKVKKLQHLENIIHVDKGTSLAYFISFPHVSCSVLEALEQHASKKFVFEMFRMVQDVNIKCDRTFKKLVRNSEYSKSDICSNFHY